MSLMLTTMFLSTSALAGAQTMTPWGDPDLQGVWTNQTPVPLMLKNVVCKTPEICLAAILQNTDAREFM
jgi:hypothetical protein